MKVGAIIGALALFLMGAVSARAQNWVSAGGDETRQFQYDQQSLKVENDYIEFWAKEIESKPVKLATNGKYYISIAVQMRAHCADNSIGFLNVFFYDEKGGYIYSENFSKDDVKYGAFPPGEYPFLLQVCAYAAGKTTTAVAGEIGVHNWTSVFVDESNNRYSVDAASIARHGNYVDLWLKKVWAVNGKTPSGKSFATTISLVRWDCDANKYAPMKLYYENTTGELIETSIQREGNLDFFEFRPENAWPKILNTLCDDNPDGAASPPAQTSLAFGTGWLSPKGYIVTASHVVEGVTTVAIYQDGKPVGSAEVVVDDAKNDIAILKPRFKTGVHPAIPLAVQPAALGEHVFTLGYPAPDDLGLSIKMTSGEVSSLAGNNGRAFGSDVRLLQTSTPVQPGNSGGPLLDEHGQAVGVVVSRKNGDADSPLQNVNYALKIAYVRSLLSELPDLGGYRPLKASASIPGLVADLRQSVFMLVVGSDEKQAD